MSETDKIESTESGATNNGDQDDATPYESMVKSLTNRGKNKRQVRLVENQLMQFAFGGSDSEDDEDFVMDQSLNTDVSDDESADDQENNEDSEEGEGEGEERDSESEDEMVPPPKVCDILNGMTKVMQPSSNGGCDVDVGNVVYKKPFLVCGVCLESHENESDEILECDSCGITVHEGCYGEIHDEEDDNKSDSDAPTEPWFCESCRANLTESPYCELCPNSGGIFKQTDTGKWVHLVCALYTPYTGFRDVSQLKTVVLEDIKSSMWGSKKCQFCVDEKFARTGVCINCDAGMCKTTFHVLCAQKNGFLSDIPDRQDNEIEGVPDLLYAHCKLHSVKLQMKKRKVAWLAFQSNLSKFKRNELDKERIEMALKHAKKNYSEFRFSVTSKPPPEEYPRLLSSCPEACILLGKKAEILGLLQHRGYNYNAALVSGRIIKTEANLTADYVSYFFQREIDIREYIQSLQNADPILNKLQLEQKELTAETHQLHEKLREIKKIKLKLEKSLHGLHGNLSSLSGQSFSLPQCLIHSKVKESEKKILTTSQLLETIVNKCSTCKSVEDQHLLTRCGTCRKYYHLSCVDPPLLRMPKTSDKFTWQCTECDSSDDSSETSDVDPNDSMEGKTRKKRICVHKIPEKQEPERPVENSNVKKRKRKKKFSPVEDKAIELKRKKHESRSSGEHRKPIVKPRIEVFEDCCLCNKSGDSSSLVKCDSCKKCYHFKLCLDPPYSKSPKGKFYGWECEDCDESDDD